MTSAWASTCPMSASSSTGSTPPPSRTTCRSSGGRAGRDGDPAVAVLFTEKKDDGLLKFMAEKTSRSAEGDADQATSALEARFQAIEQMKRRATDRQACFRKAIVRYFGEELSGEASCNATATLLRAHGLL